MSEALEADRKLLARVASGDQEAFAELSSKHLGAIVTYATRLTKSRTDAEDVAQETFLRAWQNAHRYEARSPAVAWLLTIARNAAIDRLRKKPRASLEVDDARDRAPDSTKPSELLEKKDERARVEAALDALPERQKEALLLTHEQGLRPPEVAEILGVTVEAVESLLSRGRRALRQALSEKSP